MLSISLIFLIVALSLPNIGISSIIITRITSIIFLFSGVLSFNTLYIQSIGSGIGIYSGLFQITNISQCFDIFIFILASLVITPWPIKNLVQPYLGLSTSNSGEKSSIVGPIVSEYSLIVIFTTLGSSLLLSSVNLLAMYLSLELQSFGVYILATMYRDSESATSAGLKYFLLGGLSSCLILLGAGLIYSYTGLTSFEGIYTLISSTSTETFAVTQGLELGLVLIFIGLLFKIAAAPFHNWAPDVYNDVPTIITTWLTIMPKISIVILLIEMVSSMSLPIFKTLLLISSVLSLLIGTIVGLAQVKIKRLLAFSTISHVGFLLLALAINTEESLESLIFYLIQYSITNLNAFLILLSFGYILNKSEDITLISDLKGQFNNHPILSLSLAVSLFSMAGIPPLIGFFAKQQVLYSSIANGYFFVSFVAILVSVISAYYYLKIIRVMHFEAQAVETENGNVRNITNLQSYLISVSTLSLLLFILKPSILLNSTHLMALNIFYS